MKFSEIVSFLAIVLLIAVFALALSWGAAGNQFFLYRYFAPKFAAAQRNVFENTPSYQIGTIQSLQKMQFEYEQATDAQKPALAAIIRHRAAEIDPADLPPDTRRFVESLQ